MGTQGTTEAARDDAYDAQRANACRIYHHLIGGGQVRDVDQGALERLLEINPGTPIVARENRDFMLRAAECIAREQGVDQFLDLGCAFPTADTRNLHEVVRRHVPARVLYVDCEADAVAAMARTVEGEEGIAVVQGDVLEPEAVLASDALASVLDLSRPVAVVLTGVLPFVPDEDDPWSALATVRRRLAPGSFLVLSHALTPEDWPEGADDVLALYREHVQPMYPRRERDILRFMEGFTLLEPGLVSTPAWRPEAALTEDQVRFRRAVACVGRLD